MINRSRSAIACFAILLSVVAPSARAQSCDDFELTDYSPLHLDQVIRAENIQARAITTGRFSRGSHNRGCKCDLAVIASAGLSEHDFLVLLNGNEDGTLVPSATIKTKKLPRAVAAGRFTLPGSTELDVIALVSGRSQDRGDLTLFAPRDSSGQITYEELSFGPWKVGKNTPRAGIAAGDFNGDGHLDVAVAGDRDLTVLFGSESGGFSRIQTITVQGGRPHSLAAGTFAGSGKARDIAMGIDLVEPNRGSAVRIFRWDQRAAQIKEATPAPIIVADRGTHDTLVAAADLSKPGIERDLVVAYTKIGGELFNGRVKVLVGRNGGDLFLPADSAPELKIQGAPKSLALTRIDSDAAVDLVVPTHGVSGGSDAEIHVLKGRGGSASQAGFASWKTLAARTSGQVAAINLKPQGAEPGVGETLLVAMNNMPDGPARRDAISFYVGGEDAVFGERQLVVTRTPPDVSLLTEGHFGAPTDADDIVGTEKLANGRSILSVWLGTGAGNFCPPTRPGQPGCRPLQSGEHAGQIDLGAEPYLMVAGKFDGDSLSDLAVIDTAPASGGGTRLRIYKGGEERGTFSPISVSDLEPGEKAVALAAARFTGQGPDRPQDIAILTSARDKGLLRVWKNDGTGNFEPLRPLSLPHVPLKMAVSNKVRPNQQPPKYDAVVSFADPPSAVMARKFWFLENVGGSGRFQIAGEFQADNSIDYLFIEQTSSDEFADVITFGSGLSPIPGGTETRYRAQVHINDEGRKFDPSPVPPQHPLANESCKDAEVKSIFAMKVDSDVILAGFASRGRASERRSLVFSTRGGAQGGFAQARCKAPNFPAAVHAVTPVTQVGAVDVSESPRVSDMRFDIGYAAAGRFRSERHGGNKYKDLTALGFLTTWQVQPGQCPPPTPPLQPPPRPTFCGVQITDPAVCPHGEFGDDCKPGDPLWLNPGYVCGTLPAKCPAPLDFQGRCPWPTQCTCGLVPACVTTKTYPPLLITFGNRCAG